MSQSRWCRSAESAGPIAFAGGRSGATIRPARLSSHVAGEECPDRRDGCSASATRARTRDRQSGARGSRARCRDHRGEDPTDRLTDPERGHRPVPRAHAGRHVQHEPTTHRGSADRRHSHADANAESDAVRRAIRHDRCDRADTDAGRERRAGQPALADESPGQGAVADATAGRASQPKPNAHASTGRNARANADGDPAADPDAIAGLHIETRTDDRTRAATAARADPETDARAHPETDARAYADTDPYTHADRRTHADAGPGDR
jgi:hypothetical protein